MLPATVLLRDDKSGKLCKYTSFVRTVPELYVVLITVSVSFPVSFFETEGKGEGVVTPIDTRTHIHTERPEGKGSGDWSDYEWCLTTLRLE